MSIASRALDAMARLAARTAELGRGGPVVGQVFDPREHEKGGWWGRAKVTTPPLDRDPRRLVAIYDRADRGEISELQDTYEESRLRDPRLDAVGATRVLAIQSRPWVVAAPPGFEKDREAQDIARNVTIALNETSGFATSCGHLGTATLTGLSVLELDWRLNRRGWRVPRPRWIHPNRFCVDERERVSKCDPHVDRFPGQPLESWPHKFVVHTPVAGRSTYIARRGALRSLCALSLSKRFGVRWWLQLLERWGQPQVYAKGPQGQPQLRDDILVSLRRLSEHWVSYFSRDIELGTVPMSGSVSDELHSKFAEFVNLEIAIGILGQNLTTEVQGGSHAAANIADRVRGDILVADLTELDETITDQLIAPMVHYNWPGAPVPFIRHLPVGQQPLTAQDFQTRAFPVKEFRASKGYDPLGTPDDERFYEPPPAAPGLALLPGGTPSGAPPSSTPSTTPALPSSGDGAPKVAEAALNGAQVASLMQIVQSVAKGEIPRETGLNLITGAFPIDRARAEEIMGTVGNGFVPTAEPDAQGSAPAADPLPSPPPTQTGSASSPTSSTSTSPLARALSSR